MEVHWLFFISVLSTASSLLTDLMGGQFIIAPTDMNVTANSTADFQCQANSSQPVIYSWILNGIILSPFSPPNGITFSESNGVELMTVFCDERSYNMSTVVCRVIFHDVTILKSDETTLMIQGVLHPVTNLMVHSTSTSITLSWVPPFSLDITGVDPDFTHTVEVYNITSGERSLVDTFQNITDSTFTFSLVNPDPSDTFEFVVFAVNNVGEGELSQPVRWRFGDEDTTETTESKEASNSTITSESEMEHTSTTRPGFDSESERTIIIVISIVSLVLGVFIVTILVLVTGICLRRKSSKSGEIEMKRCDAYNVVALKRNQVNDKTPHTYEDIDIIDR